MDLFEKYLAPFPVDTQEKLMVICNIIKEIFPASVLVLKYGMPTFFQNKNLIHIAAYKNHIGIYPGPKVILLLSDELKHLKTSKGAIQIPIDDNLPLALIEKIVKEVKNNVEN